MKVTILGCGSSAGVPVVGCECEVCRSPNPKNKRTRVSVLIENGDSKLLIDTSPDLRQQALRQNLSAVDAIIITHAHADHLHGIDETRTFNYHKNQPIKLYAASETLESVQQRFSYVFKQHIPEFGWYRPCLEAHEIPVNPEHEIEVAPEICVRTFMQYHGKMPTLGIRVGSFAYSTDVNNFPEESYQALENLDLWVVDCLRHEPAPTHAHLELTLSWIERFKPKRAILTHMSHHLEYDSLRAMLPPNVEPAYDGLEIEL